MIRPLGKCYLFLWGMAIVGTERVPSEVASITLVWLKRQTLHARLVDGGCDRQLGLPVSCDIASRRGSLIWVPLLPIKA